jgi:hypothetical protein
MSAKPLEPPACQGPNPLVSPPGFAIPADACDTHAHVIGPADRFPMVANRSYTPPAAPEAAYLGMLDSLGMARGVLIQISVYGTDNRCMVESLKAHPKRLRGVAVVAPDVGDAELEALHGRLLASLPPEEVFLVVRWMLPALSPRERAGMLADVPTSAEAGYPSFQATNVTGLIAPAGTPRDVVDKLNAATQKVIAQAAIREKFAAIGAVTTGGTPEDFAAYINEDFARWTRIVKEANVKVD